METLWIVVAVGLALFFLAAMIMVFVSEPNGAGGEPDLRPRMCPVCGADLAGGENILAERTGVKRRGRERIVIKGCVHCLSPDGRIKKTLAAAGLSTVMENEEDDE